MCGTLAVVGCAETELVVHTAKQLQGMDGATKPAPTVQGYYKVGNPYSINGVTYTPAENYHYAETGVASWYGAEFNGKRTANGETYDMNALTAAHRTLPLPSMVRVTNLENGRTLDLRINDRGPFANSRILDVSRRGAQLLGFFGKGTAQVRVEILPEESRMVAALAMRGDLSSVIAAAAATKPAPDDGRLVEGQWAMLEAIPNANGAVVLDAGLNGRDPPQLSALFVQAGAFADYDNAARIRKDLSRFAPVHLSQTMVAGTMFYRVRVGPSQTRFEAERLLAQIVAAGHREARLIAE
jgi:rare lipoprotein A